MDSFQPEHILDVLGRHGVELVVVGGLAAALHGVPYVTFDIDVTPEPSRQNLDRLSTALTELGARIRTQDEPEGLPFGHDGASLQAGKVWNLVTTFGDLDLTMSPSGTRGFDDVVQGSTEVRLGRSSTRIASLETVIRSKRAADRLKDRAVLPLLEETLAEIRRRSGEL